MDQLKLAPAGRSGFAVIELMIAMTIMLVVLVAVTTTSFGSQSFLISSQTNAEALNLAQELLENEQAEARKDFNFVNDVASSTDDIYEKAVYVSLRPDLLTKEVKALISWKDEHKATRFLELTTLIANFDTPVGGNTCNSNLSGDWHNPTIENVGSTNFASLVGDAGGTYTLSDLDAYRGKLYVTASNTSAPTKPTFFVFDISDPTPDLLGKVDNEGSGGTVSAGLNAVKVAEDPASSPVKTYAYVANAYGADYSTCNPATTKNCGQLAIIDVTPPTFWSFWNPSITNLALATSSAPFVTGNWMGNALFYRSGYLLFGLAKAGGAGPEFHIVDVHNENLNFLTGSAAHLLFPVGSYTVGHDVNSVNLRGTYAYVTIPNDPSAKELQIIDMQNPSTMTLAGGFDMSGGGNGKSLYLVGNRLYFGNTVPSIGNDLHVLDNTSPNSTLPEIAGTNLATSLNAIVVRNTLAFLLTNTSLEVFDVGDPHSTSAFSIGSAVGTLALPSSGSATEPSMDCEGNRLYIIANDATGHGSLYVIKPGP